MNQLQLKLQNTENENEQLKQALKQTKELMQRQISDHETLQQVHESYKQQFKDLKTQNTDLENQVANLNLEKQQINMEYQSIIEQYKEENERVQSQFEELKFKLNSQNDQNILRIKLLQELETPYQIEIQQKEQENERLQDQIFQLRRQLELEKAQNEILVSENERKIKEIKEKHKLDIKDLELEFGSVKQNIKQQKQNRQLEFQLKSEIEDEKSRVKHLENQLNKLNFVLDQEKAEKADLIEKHYKTTEKDKETIRKLQTEKEILETKNQDMEQEIKEKLNVLYNSPQKQTYKQNEISSQQGFDSVDKDFNKFKEREKLLKSLYQRIQNLQQQLADDHASNKKYTTKLENQIDSIKQDKQQQEEQFRKEKEEKNKQIDEQKQKYNQLQQENIQVRKEKDEILSQNQELTKNLLKIGGNKSFLAKGGNLQDISILSNRAFNNNSYLNDINNNFSTLGQQQQFQDQDLNQNQNQNNIINNNNNENINTQNQQQQQSQQQANFFSNKTEDQKDKMIADLQEQVKRKNQRIKELKEKLKLANAKIVELLHQKLQKHVSNPSPSVSFNNTLNRPQIPQSINHQHSSCQSNNPLNQNLTIFNYNNNGQPDIASDLNMQRDRLQRINTEINLAHKNTFRTHDFNNGFDSYY